ncbi:MAG TPA: DUF2232 domain-containing protein [Pseudolabrys sp.]|nr:DUF2232 domain-containing protein [Pseudolabrys sp.]
MMQIGFLGLGVGLGAGAAAALLFASVTSGTLLSIPLFYLAPLPIMIAALGWSHWSALIAAVLASGAIALFFGSTFFYAFLAGAGLPAWWLGYLTMLARPAEHRGNDAMPAALDWYPPGRLVVWAAVLGALIVLSAFPYFGSDAATFRATMHDTLAQMLRINTGDVGATTAGRLRNPSRLIDFLVIAIPPAAAVLATITNVVNLWLAGRVVKFSGRLTRPWPAIAEMTFPRLTAVALAISVVLSFIDGLVGIAAGVVAASLLMAYGVLGFAVLHSITIGIKSRAFLLAGVFAAVIVFGWPVLVLCLLGLIDIAFDLRTRAARRRGPPARL